MINTDIFVFVVQFVIFAQSKFIKYSTCFLLYAWKTKTNPGKVIQKKKRKKDDI